MDWKGKRTVLWAGAALIALVGGAGCARDRSQTGGPPRVWIQPGGMEPIEVRPEPPPAERAQWEQRVEAHARYAAGVIRDLRGEPREAERELTEAAKADPANEPLVMELAHRLLQQRQGQAAADLLVRSTARKDASGLLYGWLGMAQLQAGDTNAAIQAYRTAVKKAPQALIGYHGLAQLHFQMGATNQALQVLDAAAEQKEVTPAFLVDLADTLLAAGRARRLPADVAKARALVLLERAARENPTQPLVLQKMAEAYKSVGELARAAALYEELLEKHPRRNPDFEPLIREQLVRLYLLGGEKQKAAEQLREILRTHPNNPQAYLLLGSIAVEERKFADAAGYYDQALLLDPNFEPVYYDLAGMQITLGRPEQALETLARARGRFASTFLLEFYTGVAQAGLKRYAEALRSYTAAEMQARTADPARLNQVFYFQVGAAFERLADAARLEGRTADADRHYAEAEANLKKCLELAPDNDEAMNFLGYMWAERGVNLEEARGLIAKALEAEPENYAYLDSMAWVLFRLNRLPEALDYMLRAVRASEKPDATLLDHLGEIHAALGQMTEAREAWKRSLEVEPNDGVRKKLGS